MRKLLHLHERRKITFQEYGALLGARAMLASRDVLQHTPGACYAVPHEHRFNMDTVGEQRDCGTIGCIGGLMAFIMGLNPNDYVGARGNEGTASESLTPLFFPTQEWCSWDWITPAIAVKAIDNWLACGKPWYATLYREVEAKKIKKAKVRKAKAKAQKKG